MSNAKEVALKVIARTPKGAARATLLQSEALRSLVLNSGANVTIYGGELKEGKTCKEMLSDIYVGLIKRKNKHGKPDGVGALGGMAERTNPTQFMQMKPEQRSALIGQKDDVILAGNTPFLIDRMDIIRQNNVAREMREELADLGIANEQIDLQKLELVEMPNVKDDNYMINIWDGQGECYAVTPYCHLYKDSTGLVDRLSANAHEKAGGEARGYAKVPLFDALGAYGCPATKDCALEDGRNAETDYRYPHEHLAVWALAAKYLEYNPEKMVALAQEVQASNRHQISFERLAKATGQTMEDVAKALKILPTTLQKMEQAALGQFILQSQLNNTNNLRKS